MNLNFLKMLTLLKAFLVIRSTCLPQFPSLDMVRPNCLCSDTMLINDIVADINSSIKLFADDASLYMSVDDPSIQDNNGP
jgi:hypothetical protein